MIDINLIKLWYIIATSYAKLQFERFVRHFSKEPCPPVWKITDAIVLRDEHDDYVNIRSWFVPDDDWEEDVREAFPSWDDWKVELRCTYGDRKCRIVLRAGDTLVWPPSYDLHQAHIHAVRAPQGILSATLLIKPGIPGGKNIEVTQRVQKYAGFNHDYHGTTVRVRDIFPMDDHDDNAERFSGLRIIDLSPKTGLRVKIYSYATNEKINI
jgi:hypothetical protein